MAMTVVININTGAGPTAAPVTAVKWNREDTAVGTTSGIPTPASTGTNFSWIKSFQVEITATGGLTMTNIRVGKVANETVTGTKLWHTTANASYTQASGAPTPTGDNNVTAPTLNAQTASAVPLITAPPSVYAAGPFAAAAAVGNFVEVSLGVDNTNSAGGTAVATPTLRWVWTEA